MLQLQGSSAVEELLILRIGTGIPRFDEVDSQGIQGSNHFQLVFNGETDSFALTAVVEGGVKDRYLHMNLLLSLLFMSMSFSKEWSLVGLKGCSRLAGAPSTILLIAARQERIEASITSVDTPRPR